MNKGRIISGIILIIIALVLLDILVAFLNPPVDETETIVGEGSYSYQATLMGEDIIKGDFRVKSNNTINFFICDEENYKKYRESSNYSEIEYYKLKENVSEWSYEFKTPGMNTFWETEKWYVIYDISNSTANQTIVESNIEYEPYRTLLYYVKILLIVIAVIQILLGLKPKQKSAKLPPLQ